MDKDGFTITITPLERGPSRDTGSMLRTSSSAEDSLPTGRPRLSKIKKYIGLLMFIDVVLIVRLGLQQSATSLF